MPSLDWHTIGKELLHQFLELQWSIMVKKAKGVLGSHTTVLQSEICRLELANSKPSGELGMPESQKPTRNVPPPVMASPTQTFCQLPIAFSEGKHPSICIEVRVFPKVPFGTVPGTLGSPVHLHNAQLSSLYLSSPLLLVPS